MMPRTKWPTLKYSRSQVDKAGYILTNPPPNHAGVANAVGIVSNWRSCHTYPINTFQSTLRVKLRSLRMQRPIVAQRLKRLPSIIKKLRRGQNRRLSTMQDIGGLRAVVTTPQEVSLLKNSYLGGQLKHELLREDDYIASPTKFGYRGVHLVYKYRNTRAPQYNNLRIEIQLRSWVQHVWGTAVETMGTFTGNDLKAGEGPGAMLNFFSIASSAFAHYENCSPMQQHLSLDKMEIYRRTCSLAQSLDVFITLKAYAKAIEIIDTHHLSGHYYLVKLDRAKRRIIIKSYRQSELIEANENYIKLEAAASADEDFEVVLVRAGSIDMLKRAYPNYFLDISQFIDLIILLEAGLKANQRPS